MKTSELLKIANEQCFDCPILLATEEFTKADCPACEKQLFADMAQQLEMYKVKKRVWE